VARRMTATGSAAVVPLPESATDAVAYQELASWLRAEIASNRFPAGQRLPTEAELVARTGFSRQTVRRAFQELVSEGAVYRVRGRGTFAVPGHGRYLRSFGSVDDLMSLSLDTQLQVVEPLHVRASLDIAEQLQVADDVVMALSFTRLHEGLPFCFTQVHVPLELGRRLKEVDAMRELAEPGARSTVTVIELVEQASGGLIHGARQAITAERATADVARWVECVPGEPVLRIDRMYWGADQQPLELAINYFNPDRYSYRLQLRGRAQESLLSRRRG
jgi:GntR family transcriptional regulator